MTDRDHTPERSAEGLLSLIAAAGEGELAQLKARLARDDVEWDGLIDWVHNWPYPPADVASMHAWLRETEDLGRAHVSLSRLGDVGHADRARRALASSLERARTAVEARADHALHAREAEKQRPIPPWSWIRRGDLERLLEHENATGEVVRLATQAGLSAEDEVLFVREVAIREPVLHAYRSLVRSLVETVHVTTWTPAWSLDVARDASELDDAAELLRVHLPHAGGTLSARQHAGGTWWRYPSGTEELVPSNTRLHRWSDPLLGALETRIDVHAPTPAEDTWHGVASLMCVASGQGKTRGLEVARALATALAHGAMSRAIEAAHRAFEAGDDLDPEDERLVSHAFVARMLMSEAAAQLAAQNLDVAPLMDALARADDRHRAHRSASFLVPDDVYDDHASALPVDPAEWWGHRAAVEAVVPAGAIESALGRVTQTRRDNVVHYLDAGPAKVQPPGRETDQDSPRAYDVNSVTPYTVGVRRIQRAAEPVTGYGHSSNVIAFPSARAAAASEVTRLAAASAPTLHPDLPGKPCPWLHAAANEAPTPGRVPLILYDEEHDRGVLTELRVFVSDTAREADTWAAAPMLERIARDSIRDAHRAATGCTTSKIAPHPFTAHRLELVVEGVAEDARLSVDGASIGLGAALAFASAWLDRPIARDIVPIGAITRWGAVGAVGAVGPKASAITADVTFLVSEKNAADVSGARAQPVAMLAEALEAAGLALSGLTVHEAPERDRLHQLAELVEIAELGDLKRLGERTRWSDVGDGIRHIVDTFDAATPHADSVIHARVMAALAYSHAGALEDTKEMLRGVDRAVCTSLETRTLFDIVELGAHIDRQSLDKAEAREVIARLEADVAALRAGHPRMLGRALGTLGRAHMHRNGEGDVAIALPMLAEAIAVHAVHEPHEVARSRQYYAMALRMSGEPEAALQELVQAQHDLETLTRHDSYAY